MGRVYETIDHNVNNYKPTIVEQIRAIIAFPFAYAAVFIGGGYFCVLIAKTVLEIALEVDGDTRDHR